MKYNVPQMPVILGLAGIAQDENPRARRVARFLEWPMTLLACWIVLEWFLEASFKNIGISIYGDWLIWAFFSAETLLMTLLVDNKPRYLIGNWVNLAIVVLGFPLLWVIFPHAGGLRALRLVVMVSLIMPVSGTLKKVLARHHLGTTLLVCFMVIIVAGTLMASIDPNVKTPLDGIWWAWVTVTTVGYGDIVPVSTAGRLFAAMLILMGIGMFTMLTASFAAFFMAEDEKDILKIQAQNIKKLNEIENRMMLLEHKLDALLSEEQRRHAAAAHEQQLKHPRS